jgi:hypothetical protein
VPIVSDGSPGGNAAVPRRRVRNVKPRRPPTKPQRRPGEPLPREDLEGLCPFDRIVAQYRAVGLPATETDLGDGRRRLYAACPHCESRASNPSSMWSEQAPCGKVAAICYKSDCRADDMLEPLGLEVRDLYPRDGEHIEERNKLRLERYLDGTDGRLSPPPPLDDETVARMAEEQARCVEALSARPRRRAELAEFLGVSEETLDSLEPGWRAENILPDPEADGFRDAGPAWTFPMLSGTGQIVNVQRRFLDSAVTKRGLSGGRLGLFVPRGWERPSGPVILVEGASDTAVCTELRFCVIGRPNNRLGAYYAYELLKNVNRPVVVIGENDQSPDGRWPGDPAPFAKELTRWLGRSVGSALPPQEYKDVRDWYQKASRCATRSGLFEQVKVGVRATKTTPGTATCRVKPR